jgi:hypothetical protein
MEKKSLSVRRQKKDGGRPRSFSRKTQDFVCLEVAARYSKESLTRNPILDTVSETGKATMIKRGIVKWQVNDNFSVEVEAEVTFTFDALHIIQRLISIEIGKAWHIHYESRNLVSLSIQEKDQATKSIRQESWNWEGGDSRES